MNTRFNGAILNRGAQLVVTLAVALSVKQFYSTANVDELRWILAPTTFLVELVTNKQFVFESRAGYMSSDHTFLIAASCAGVNFLLTSFLLLALSRVFKRETLSWLFIPGCLLASYVATLMANTVRIAVALKLQRTSLGGEWLDAGQIHRTEGIVIYFGFLLLLYLVSEQLGTIRERVSSLNQPKSVGKLLFFPLLIYYVTTLVMPFLNGAYQKVGFWQHAMFVMVIPVLVLLPFAMLLVVGKWKTD